MLESMGVSAGRESVYVSAQTWDGCRVEWLGGGRPQRKRLAAVEKYEGARLEAKRWRLMVEVEGADVCGCSVVAVEADRTRFDVEVAAVMTEVRELEALEYLEVTLGGRRVELMEAEVLSRPIDAGRMN